MEYYDGTRLLSQMDINGKKPEIYMTVGNRTGGKTTYFHRLLVNQYKKGRGKFFWVGRKNYDVDNISESFFKDIGGLFFPGYRCFDKSCKRGIYHEIFLKTPGGEDVSCGYATYLNAADAIKKISHLFTDVNRMYMDEFMSETNTYLDDEVTKLQSIHTSVARGNGEMVRYVPLYMSANTVSMLNPYYLTFGIGSRIKKDTKFLRGEGWVLEQYYNPDAAEAQKSSAFNRAFKNNRYTDYASENVYLNDNIQFIDRPVGKNRYCCTLKYKGNLFGVREYKDLGVMYCDDKADASYPHKVAVTTDDHTINWLLLEKNEWVFDIWRRLFRRGCWRFKNLQCKEAVMTALSY